MVGLVVVSHSAKAAEGICEVAEQMASGVAIEPAGGEEHDGEAVIGTSVDRIRAAIEAADDGDGVVVLVDLGSAVMNTELAIEMVEADVEARIADAPVLEAAVNAAVEATSTKATLDSVVDAAEEAREYRKL